MKNIQLEEYPTCEEVFGLLYFLQLKNKPKCEDNDSEKKEKKRKLKKYKEFETKLILLIAKVLLNELEKKIKKKKNKKKNKLNNKKFFEIF